MPNPLQFDPALSCSSQVGWRYSSSPLGEFLGGQAWPLGLYSCLLCCCPSNWACELLQQTRGRLCKLLCASGSFETGWVPSGNEGIVPSQLDKGCSGTGSIRYLTLLNFQSSPFQMYMLGNNLPCLAQSL